MTTAPLRPTDTSVPARLDGGLAFMFETTYMMKLTPGALEESGLDTDYWKCWQDLKPHFQEEMAEARRAFSPVGSGGVFASAHAPPF